MKTFNDFGLSESTLWALEKKGYEQPSPIQAACIPLLLGSDKDVIGQAQTGTGKTAAFSIPVIEKIDPAKKSVQAIILTPTRELAIQVAEEMSSFKWTKRLSVAVLYGGASITQQISALRGWAQIVVGTPGRVMDMINKRHLKIKDLTYFILDEADEMLNMWFLEDIEEILKSTNEDKQMLFFSATMPRAILSVAKTYMKEYEVVKVAAQQLTTANTTQIYFEVREHDKMEALTRIVDSEKEFYGIVFCRTKRECDDVTAKLQSRWYTADAIHGDHEQRTRERVLNKFKAKKTLILVATDVAARGIDVNDLTHVVNYHIPQDPESYTHRIGRTGRAWNKGTAITLITPNEWRKLAFIQRKTNSEITKQQLPSIDEVVDNKKENIRNQITGTIDDGNLEKYESFVTELLEKYDHPQVIKALVKIAFSDQLDAKAYKSIQWVVNNVDAAWTTRLFVARGRSHGITGPKELVDYLVEETSVRPNDINDVKVLEDFSFVTLPFIEAEVVIDAFKRKPGRSMVSKAKDNGWWWRSGGSRGWSRSGYGGSRGRSGGGDRARSPGNRTSARRSSSDRPRSDRRPTRS